MQINLFMSKKRVTRRKESSVKLWKDNRPERRNTEELSPLEINWEHQKTFVAQLEVVVHGFMNPLYALSFKRPNIISHKQISALFSNVEEVYRTNLNLLHNFETKTFSNIALFWLAHLESLCCYEPYFQGHNTSLSLLYELISSGKKEINIKLRALERQQDRELDKLLISILSHVNQHYSCLKRFRDQYGKSDTEEKDAALACEQMEHLYEFLEGAKVGDKERVKLKLSMIKKLESNVDTVSDPTEKSKIAYFAIEEIGQWLENAEGEELETLPSRINTKLQQHVHADSIELQSRILLLHSFKEKASRLPESTTKSNILLVLKEQKKHALKTVDHQKYSNWALFEKIMTLPTLEVDFFGSAVAFLHEKVPKANQDDPVVITIREFLPSLIPGSLYLYEKKEIDGVRQIEKCLALVLMQLELRQRQNSHRFILQFSYPLTYIKRRYSSFIERYVIASDEERLVLACPRAQLTGAGLAFFTLDQEVARELLCLDDRKVRVKSNSNGTHAVARKNGVFYKPNSEGMFFIGPEREFAIFSMYNILGCSSMAPTCLAKIQTVIFPKDPYPSPHTFGKALQASYGIDGILLQDILGILDLLPFIDSWSSNNNNSTLHTTEAGRAEQGTIFSSLWSGDLFNDFQKKNPDLNCEVLVLLPIEEVAELIITEFENIFANLLPAARCLEFNQIPCANVTRRDIYTNIHNHGVRGLVGALSLLSCYPEAAVSTTHSGTFQNSFTRISDFFQYIEKLKKLFPTYSQQEMRRELKMLPTKFNHANFSSHIIASLLTNPQDHKSDNLMITVKYNNQGSIEELCIIGIDNDLALTLDENNVHSMLYFLEPMDQPIEASVRRHFLQLTPEGIIFDWLASLEEQNQKYRKCQERNIFLTSDMVEEDGARSLKIPFEIDTNLIPYMYKKAKKLTKILQNNPKATHRELFEGVQPGLARAYRQADEAYSSFEMKYNQVKEFLPEDNNSHYRSDLSSYDNTGVAALKFIQRLDLMLLPISVQVSLLGNAVKTFSGYDKILQKYLANQSEEVLRSIFHLAVEQKHSLLVAHILELQKRNLVYSASAAQQKQNRLWLPTDGKGRSALLMACDSLSYEIVQVLLLYKANPNAVDLDGYNGIMIALTHFGENPMAVARIIRLLGTNAPNLLWNQSDYVLQRTVLHHLISVSQLALCEAEPLLDFLIEHGASPDLVDKEGKTALDLAMKEKNIPMVRQLIGLGAGRTMSIPVAIPFFVNHSLPDMYDILSKQSLLLRWNLALNSLREVSVPAQKCRNSLEGAELGMVRLPDALLHHLTERGEIRPGIEYGRRNVQEVEIGEGRYQLFFKQNPEMPGIEYAVGTLFELLIGHGTSFTDLAKFTIGVHHFPVLISQGIKGDNLHDVLQCPMKTEEMNKFLDRQSFSEVFLASLLVNFEDGKPDNFIVEPLPNGSSRLVGIDNDHAFVPPIAKGKQTKLLVKCILYCLDIMKEPIHPQARERFLAMDVEQILRIWLERLCSQSKRYNNLFSLAEHKTLSKVKKNTWGTVISIPFTEGSISAIFQKFKRLQQVLRESKILSGLEVLRLVIPSLGIRYEEAFYCFPTPMERFFSLAATQYSIAIAGRYETMLNSRQLLKSMSIDPKISLGSNYGPEKALSELIAIKKETQSSLSQRKEIQTELMKGNTIPFERLMLDTEKEKLINGDAHGLVALRFHEMELLDQQKVLNVLVKSNFRKIMFHGCHLLQKRALVKLMLHSPGLLTVEFHSCLKLAQPIPNVLSKLEFLSSIVLDDLTEIVGVLSFLPCMNLRKLKITRCHGITEIHFIRNISNLHVEHCWSLQHITAFQIQEVFKTQRRTRWIPLSSSNVTKETQYYISKLLLRACPKLSVWWTIFGSWLRQSPDNYIKLNNCPFLLDKDSLQDLIVSVLNSVDVAIVPKMLCAVFPHFYFTLDSVFEFIARWRIFSASDLFAIVVLSYEEMFDKIVQFQCFPWSRHVNDSRILMIGKKLVNLESLNMRHSVKVSDDAFCTLKLSELRFLDISRCQNLSNNTLEVIGSEGKKITELWVESCPRITDEGFHHLSNLTLLQRLYLRKSNIKSCPFHGKMKCLRKITLDYSDIQDHGINQITLCCPSLYSFSLGGCFYLTDDAFVDIHRRCPMLGQLNVREIKGISDIFLREIVQCAQLVCFDISGCCRLTNEGVQMIRRMEHLQELHMNGLYLPSLQLRVFLDGFENLRVFDSPISCIFTSINDLFNSTNPMGMGISLPNSSSALQMAISYKNFYKLHTLSCQGPGITDSMLDKCEVLFDDLVESNENLKELSFSYASITNDLLSNLIDLTTESFTSLSLHCCLGLKPSSSSYSSLFRLPIGLTCLTLSHCLLIDTDLCGAVTALLYQGYDPHFEVLKLSYMPFITDGIAIGLHDQLESGCETFEISHCKVGEETLRLALSWKSLKYLNMSNCFGNSTGESVGHRNDATGMYYSPLLELKMNYCKTLTCDGLKNIMETCPSLTALHLSHIRLTGPAGFTTLPKNNLSVFDVSFVSQITDEELIHIALHSLQLNELFLSHCFLLSDESLIFTFRTCIFLNSIDLSYCYKVSDAVVKEVASHCRTLCSFVVEGCTLLSDASLFSLSDLELKVIIISYCHRMTDAGIAALRCERLISVHLSHCPHLTAPAILRLCKKSPIINSLHITGIKMNEELLRHLKDLFLDEISLGDFIRPFTPQDLLPFSRCSFISIVNNDQLTDLSFSAMIKNSLARSINISGSKIELEGLQHISQHLEELTMSHCSGVTDKICSLLAPVAKRLRHLDISHCGTVRSLGLLEFVNLNYLEYLNVEGSKKAYFGDTRDSEICNQFFPKCRFLAIRSQPRKGNIPNGKCENAQSAVSTFKVNESELERIIKAIPNAIDINIDSSMVTNEGLNKIGSHWALECLSISACSKLTELGIAHCLAQCPSIRKFVAKRLQLTWDGVDFGTLLPNLREVNLSGNFNIADSSLFLLSKCLYIDSLDVSGCDNLSDDSLIEIAHHCKAITKLYLANCSRITPYAIERMMQIRILSLQELNIEGCSISDGVMREVGRYGPSLERLNLSSCFTLDSTILTEKSFVQNIICKVVASLKKLEMRECPLSESGVMQLLPHLKRVKDLDIDISIAQMLR